MISQEKFTQLVKDLDEGVMITSQVLIKGLVQTIAELDARCMVAEQTIQMTLDTAERLMADVAKGAIQTIGIRDHAKARKLAKLAGEAAGRLTGAVELFMAGKVLEAQQAVWNMGAETDEGAEDTETTEVAE